jgi:hypothetical protein
MMFLKLDGVKGESKDGLGLLIAAGIFVAFAPMAARANAATIPEEIATLQAEVAALQSQVNTQKEYISTLRSQVNTQQKQLTVARSVLALAPFVSVDPNPKINVRGPNIVFKGANIHIESGSGATDDHGNRTGLGNLIIGYNEAPDGLTPGARGGSHNLVIGKLNSFTQAAFGGLVAGEGNTISNEGVSISGGINGIASGLFSSISGGSANTASGSQSSITGGNVNTASGLLASVTGGQKNVASGAGAVVIGGNGVTDGNTNGIAPVVAP